MKLSLPESLKSFSIYEMIWLFVFIIYIVFPIEAPFEIAQYLDSALGMAIIFCITVYLFLYTNPVLGILFIFVAYEILRRSSAVTGRVAIMQYTPSEPKRQAEMVAMNPPEQKTLEEEVVDLRAPLGQSPPTMFTESSFKPVADNVNGASLF
jgi:hypothetical protein